MAWQVSPRSVAIRQRVMALAMVGVFTGLIGGCTVNDNPDKLENVTDEQAIQLIDGMRGKGSYEAAWERLNATAREIAERITAAVPGQTWKFRRIVVQTAQSRHRAAAEGQHR